MSNFSATSSAPGADNSNFDADPPTDSSTASAATHTAHVAADQAAHVRDSTSLLSRLHTFVIARRC
jgi:hypothetical protein